MGDTAIGTIERAFQLARSGECASASDIRSRLTREGFASVNEHLSGPSIRRDLNTLCKTARLTRAGLAEPEAPPPADGKPGGETHV
jgi:hypothetical protein